MHLRVRSCVWAPGWSHLIVLVCFLCFCDGNLFFVRHLRLIEQAENGNFMYRGGNPNFVGFEYHTLERGMKKEAVAAEKSFPPEYYLIDINLENPKDPIDEHHINEERTYFSKHPEQGDIILHTILGEDESPYDYNETYVQARAITFDLWSQDNLPEFIEQIHNIITETNSTIPTVTFIHCECGCDRTGEISGSYYMAYMNMSLHDAHDLDKSIAGREILPNNHNALDWYCFYLKYAQGFNLTCEP